MITWRAIRALFKRNKPIYTVRHYTPREYMERGGNTFSVSKAKPDDRN